MNISDQCEHVSVSTSDNDELMMSVLCLILGLVRCSLLIDFDDRHGVQNLVVKLHFLP